MQVSDCTKETMTSRFDQHSKTNIFWLKPTVVKPKFKCFYCKQTILGSQVIQTTFWLSNTLYYTKHSMNAGLGGDSVLHYLQLSHMCYSTFISETNKKTEIKST